ncbi:MAG TPA: hypothetical protein VK571_05540 [Gemmatimonadaceae bacterium]|nr:hypothetical protein [Gemmatimonadaceae bacterium]
MTKTSCLILLATASLAACTRSGSENAASDSSTTTASSSVSPAVPAAGTATGTNPAGTASGTPASACPRTGQWAICSVERRLAQSGFVVRHVSGEAPRRAGFSVKPAVYTLGKSRLEVFIYPSESALASDVAKIDTATAAPHGAPNPWPFFSPTFVRSGNLAAVFLTENGTQAERLTNALAAGAPQP